MTHPHQTMPEFERVKAAMKLVAKHKLKYLQILDEELDVLAEAAIKMMWLIEEENNAG